jgi:hypothetical protein
MGINMEDLSTPLSVAALAERQIGETIPMRVKESYPDQTGLELFQRALSLRNDEAWNLLVERYQGLVMAWVRNHSRREIAYRYHNPEYYVALAFERFWQATTRNQSLVFTSLEAALSYLKASLNGAILDTLRTYARPEVPLPEPGHPHPIELASEDYTYEYDLWDAIKNLIPTPREQRVAYLLFHCGLKPREIVQFCQDEFSDVREVHRLRRNVVERLLRQADTIRWRLSDEA